MSKRHRSKFPENNLFVSYENTPFEILQTVIFLKKIFFIIIVVLQRFGFHCLFQRTRFWASNECWKMLILYKIHRLLQ